MKLSGTGDASGGPGYAGGRSAVTIRRAGDADRPALERLAQRDSGNVPPAPLLLAEREGRIDAVLSLPTGAVIADPFRRTAELVELLRCQAAVARAGTNRRARPRPRLPRTLGRPRLAGAGGRP